MNRSIKKLIKGTITKENLASKHLILYVIKNQIQSVFHSLLKRVTFRTFLLIETLKTRFLNISIWSKQKVPQGSILLPKSHNLRNKSQQAPRTCINHQLKLVKISVLLQNHRCSRKILLLPHRRKLTIIIIMTFHNNQFHFHLPKRLIIVVIFNSHPNPEWVLKSSLITISRLVRLKKRMTLLWWILDLRHI